MKTLLALIAVSLLCALFAGCGSTDRLSRPDAAITADVPGDFWLSVTVIGPVRSGANPYSALEPTLRPARYVLESDRILRAALGPAANDQAFPPQTRRLTHDQMLAVWTSVRSADVLSSDHPDIVGSGPTPEMVAGETVYIITASANGKRQTIVVPIQPAPGAMADQSRAIVAELARLAWVK